MPNQRIQFQVSRRSSWKASGPDRLVFEAPSLLELRNRVQAFVRARYGDSARASLMVGGPPASIHHGDGQRTERSAA
jgi:hypothetical protein